MKTVIKKFCNFIVTVSFVTILIYTSFFTDIPVKIQNFIQKNIEVTKTTYEEYNNDFKINELSISMNDFYYNSLTEGQQKIYASIANAIKLFQSEFVIRDYNALDKDDFAKEVNIAIEAFTNDHPEVFYIQAQYSSYVTPSFNGNYGYVRLNYTEETYEAVEEKISEMKQVIDSYIEGTEDMSEYEKEVYIHDKLSYAIRYSKEEELPRKYHTAEGTLLEKIGVCDSFAKALQLIYNQVGIDSIVVIGELDERPHAWNLVKIEDEWYHVDITSSHSIFDDTGLVNHAYFNLNTEGIKKFSTMENEDIIPYSEATKYNYYTYNGLEILEGQILRERLEDICKKFESEPYIEFYIEGNVGDKISDILSTLKFINSSFIKNSKMYYYNIENDIIIPKN